MNRIKLVSKSMAYSWKLVLESSKWRIFLYFALRIATTSFPLLSAFLLKYVLDELTTEMPEIKEILAVVVIYGLSLVINQGSVLGRYYADNGKDLSGGQWQLVGLARAYFKDSEYMILDEPSAALDPISEDRIFEQLYHLSEGKSSVTISHRLSNTTLADKILVIGDGHIIEQGSHFELLRQGGKYAELFHLQASKYI